LLCGKKYQELAFTANLMLNFRIDLLEMTRSQQQEALGQSEAFLDFQERLSRVAPVERPVLLIGERGTGKELAAFRLHFLSQRWQGPFITLNCSTLSPTLIESELFGHERGAFTGARDRRIGRFEAAHGGTLFLDEVGTIPITTQEKILRVVEYGAFERVGGSRSVEVDVRIVGATNADLLAMADRGEFKRDLLDRFSFEVLFLPPLRHRGEDIMLLARHFAARMGYELGIESEISFSRSAVAALESHSWEGNIRELKNVVERAVYKAESGRIETIDFNPFISPYVPATEAPEQITQSASVRAPDAIPDLHPGFKNLVSAYEIELLRQALAMSKYNQKRAATLLDLTYDQLRGLLRKYREALDGDGD
jgi:psp operon transcriptional activator